MGTQKALLFVLAGALPLAIGFSFAFRTLVDFDSYQKGFQDGVVKARSAVYSSYDGDYQEAAGKILTGSADYRDGFAVGHQNGYGRGITASRKSVDALVEALHFGAEQ